MTENKEDLANEELLKEVCLQCIKRRGGCICGHHVDENTPLIEPTPLDEWRVREDGGGIKTK